MNGTQEKQRIVTKQRHVHVYWNENGLNILYFDEENRLAYSYVSQYTHMYPKLVHNDIVLWIRDGQVPYHKELTE